MNLRRLLPAVLVGVAIGVLIFLLRMTQSVDSELHLQRLDNLQAINTLDVQFNRTLTQAHVAALMTEGDERAVLTEQLGNALDALDVGKQGLHGLSPALDKALDEFLDTIKDKVLLGLDFQARTTRDPAAPGQQHGFGTGQGRRRGGCSHSGRTRQGEESWRAAQGPGGGPERDTLADQPG